MVRRIKRGGPFPSGALRHESQILGGRPSWDAWKHNIENKFDIDLRTLRNGDEAHLKVFYGLRRRIQAEESSQETIETIFEWRREIIEKDPNFLERNREILHFIAERTVSPSSVQRERGH